MTLSYNMHVWPWSVAISDSSSILVRGTLYIVFCSFIVKSTHWTKGWKCLWRGHSVNQNRPLLSQKHFCIGTTLLFLLTRRMAAAVENVSTTVGTQVTPTTLPNFQMGRNMTWAKVPDLAWSANTFSIIKPKSVGDAYCMLSLDTPLHVYVCVSSKGEHVRTARSTKCHTLYGTPSQTMYGTHTPAVSVPSSESLPPLTPSWSRGRSILETHRTPASRCSWGWTPGQPPT